MTTQEKNSRGFSHSDIFMNLRDNDFALDFTGKLGTFGLLNKIVHCSSESSLM